MKDSKSVETKVAAVCQELADLAMAGCLWSQATFDSEEGFGHSNAKVAALLSEYLPFVWRTVSQMPPQVKRPPCLPAQCDNHIHTASCGLNALWTVYDYDCRCEEKCFERLKDLI